MRRDDRIRSSTGSSFLLVADLGDLGLPGVYLARVLETQTVAMPPLVLVETFSAAGADPASLDMLLDEDLWLPRLLRAPEFVRLYEAGRLLGDAAPAAAGGPYRAGGAPSDPFVVLEPAQGVPLATLLRVARSLKRRLPQSAAAGIGLGITRSLAALHALRDGDGTPLRAVFRGLDPSRVFLSLDGSVRLLPPVSPWLASLASAGSPSTQLAYLAPELVRGEAPTLWSDLYALGAVLWEVLAGKPPFVRATERETLRAVLDDDPPRLSEAGAKVPKALAELVSALLEKTPGARPGGAEDVARVLADLQKTTSDGGDAPALVAAEWMTEAHAPHAASWATFACLRAARDDAAM